jgi:5-methylcytosine-specific restriction endonuclease McrA
MSSILHALAEEASREAGCTMSEMMGPSRRQPVAGCRQAAMRAGLDAGFSSVEVARYFNRDHTTVLHAAKRLSRQTVAQLPLEQRLRIIARDNGTCAYCGGDFWIGVDHVVPRSKGGTDADANLVACCRSCNSSKRDKTPEEWLAAG